MTPGRAVSLRTGRSRVQIPDSGQSLVAQHIVLSFSSLFGFFALCATNARMITLIDSGESRIEVARPFSCTFCRGLFIDQFFFHECACDSTGRRFESGQDSGPVAQWVEQYHHLVVRRLHLVVVFSLPYLFSSHECWRDYTVAGSTPVQAARHTSTSW